MNNDNNNNNNNNHHHHQAPRNSHPACASCRYQRRKCQPDCALARYFPPENQSDFLNAHRLFGVSNINKIIKDLDPALKDEAMRTIIYQSNARAADPVAGCCRIIENLRRQIDLHVAELKIVMRQLAFYRAQAQQQQQQMHILQDESQQQELGFLNQLPQGATTTNITASSSDPNSSSSSSSSLFSYGNMQDLVLPNYNQYYQNQDQQQQQQQQQLLFHNLTLNEDHETQGLIESGNPNLSFDHDQWLMHDNQLSTNNLGEGPSRISLDGGASSSSSLSHLNHHHQDHQVQPIMIDEKPLKNQAFVEVINEVPQALAFDVKENTMTHFSEGIAENDESQIEIEEDEALSTENVHLQEHDLREAASLFSLTNNKT